MSKIICKINLGALKQNLYVSDDEDNLTRFSLTTEEIPEFIAKQQDVKDIYIHGANKDFLTKIEIDTRKKEYNLYAKDTKFFHYI